MKIQRLAAESRESDAARDLANFEQLGAVADEFNRLTQQLEQGAAVKAFANFVHDLPLDSLEHQLAKMSLERRLELERTKPDVSKNRDARSQEAENRRIFGRILQMAEAQRQQSDETRDANRQQVRENAPDQPSSSTTSRPADARESDDHATDELRNLSQMLEGVDEQIERRIPGNAVTDEVFDAATGKRIHVSNAPVVE